MYNYNFGGIKGSSPDGLSVMARTREGWGATERTITDRFRAYRTPEQGAADYISLLQERYPEALEAAKAGDPVEFVSALKANGYFTGNESAYARSVSQLAASALGSGFDSIGYGGEVSAEPLELHFENVGEHLASLGQVHRSGTSVYASDFVSTSASSSLSGVNAFAFADAMLAADLRQALVGETERAEQRRDRG
jgi:hypothetical protein